MMPVPAQPDGPSTRYSRGLHLTAILTACAVFPLVFVGAGVTSKDAGMAYPDGFTSNGYFLQNPPGWWDRDDTRWEHGHRLLGRTVGVLAIGVAIWSWRRGGLVRALALASLSAIVVQGVFGAFRVNEVSTTLAMIHGIWGQLCFCLACTVALVTGRSWHSEARVVGASSPPGLGGLCVASTVFAFLQLVSGAAYRHFAADAALLLHVVGAIAVTLLAGWTAMSVMGDRSGPRSLVRLGGAVAVLLVVQLFLGGFAFTVTVMGGSRSAQRMWSSQTVWSVPSAHVAVGALLLAGLVLVTLSTDPRLRFRRLSPREREVSGPLPHHE